jgi:hypothetical protein
LGKIQLELCIISLGAPETEDSPEPASEYLRRQLAFDARVEWRSASRAEEVLEYLAAHVQPVLVLISVATHEEAIQAVVALKLLASAGGNERCVAIALVKAAYGALEPNLRMHGCAEVLIELEESPLLAETAIRWIERFDDQRAIQLVERSGNSRGFAAFLLSEWMNRADVESEFSLKVRKLLG